MTLTLLVTYALLLGFAAALVVSVARLATLLPTYGTQFTALTNEAIARLDDFGVTPEQVTAALARINPTTVIGLLQTALSSVLGVLSDLLFLAALIFFLAADAASFPRRLAAAAEQRPRSWPRWSTSPAAPGSTWWSPRSSG